MTEIPDLRDKDVRWLTAFTEEAVLARSERNIAAAEGYLLSLEPSSISL